MYGQRADSLTGPPHTGRYRQTPTHRPHPGRTTPHGLPPRTVPRQTKRTGRHPPAARRQSPVPAALPPPRPFLRYAPPPEYPPRPHIPFHTPATEPSPTEGSRHTRPMSVRYTTHPPDTPWHRFRTAARCRASALWLRSRPARRVSCNNCPTGRCSPHSPGYGNSP